MMDGYLCPDCGKVSHQFLSPKLAMEKVAKDCGVPFLISIPQTPAVGLLKPYFDRLAKMVLKGQPIALMKQTPLQRVQEKAGELRVKAAGKFMSGESLQSTQEASWPA